MWDTNHRRTTYHQQLILSSGLHKQVKDPPRTNVVTYIISRELWTNNTWVQVAGQRAQTILYTEPFHNRGNMGWQFYSVLVFVVVLAVEAPSSDFIYLFF